MPMHPFIAATVGGVLIGLSASALLALIGRIAGISGIASGVLDTPSRSTLWRYAFVAGLLTGGILLRLYFPQAFSAIHPQSILLIALGGLLVGYGTRLGSGCTSGHGVCGLARRSLRSVYATVTFMLTGMLTVYLVKLLSGAP